MTEGRTHANADRLLRRTGRAGAPWIWGLAATAVVLAIAETALPAVLGAAIDGVIEDRDPGGWLVVAAALIVVLVAADALDDLAGGGTVANSTAWLRNSLLHQILALGTRATDRFESGDIGARLVGNSAQVGAFAPLVVRAGANLIPGVGGIVALALIDPWLCLTFLAGMPVLLLVLRRFARDASEVVGRYLEVQGRIAARLADALGGSRTIAAAATQEREAERILDPLPELHRHGLENWRTQMRLTTQDFLLVMLLEVAVLAVAGVELANGRITPGELIAAGQYVALGATLGHTVSSLAQLGQARAAAARVAAVLDAPAPAYGSRGLAAGPGRVDFRGVTVRRDDRTVLDGIDLAIPGGSLVAIVGRSGSGKSLLAALAGRLIDPDEGEIRLDGVPLPELGREELRRAVGYGFEHPLLFGETLAETIAFGVDAPQRAEVVAAARAARAHDVIEHMPDGYDTPLSAAPMSGGEAQRVGLARTFAHAGRVLILDDVAASLDTVTEHQVSRALTEELGDRTRLIVAHRASTAARTDLVIWLEDGRVRAIGPHAELERRPGYRALFAADGASRVSNSNGAGGGRT